MIIEGLLPWLGWADPQLLDMVHESIPVFLEGATTTLTLFAQAGIIGFVLGCFIALCKARCIPKLYWLGWLYVELFRNVPLLIVLFFFYYGLQLRSDLAGLLSLSGWASAFLAEVIRGGIESVEDGQLQAARVLGLNNLQRITAILMPQGLLRVLPILANTFMNLAKNTSIIYFVGVLDMTYAFEQLSARYFLFFQFFAVALLFYMGLCLAITYAFKGLDLWLNRARQPMLNPDDWDDFDIPWQPPAGPIEPMQRGWA
ncbi:MAG: amino acid ABC transporter permease [Cyanobacteria bacterium HKST-UBA04]|nr:amino acid ABC transporter permease [Cyanobacteria bacterium HKST-UBA04]MCA9841052.1 amino acid ABC transporter permease [Cyanobacteria bacterium HKST-UBA03]